MAGGRGVRARGHRAAVTPQGEGPYSTAWRRYRQWSWAFWIVFGLYLPGLAFVSRTLGWTRCGELFFRKFDARPWRADWQHNPFARRCTHCGLPKWATRDPDPR